MNNDGRSYHYTRLPINPRHTSTSTCVGTTASSRCQCQNCGQYHPLVNGRCSQHCVKIKIRSHRKGLRSQTSDGSWTSHHDQCTNVNTGARHTVPLPGDVRGRANFFDSIYFWFADHKIYIDRKRDYLQDHVEKGTLKIMAPIPWLRWAGCDGESGQTRNQENWDKMWKSFSYCSCSGQEQLIAWVTICVDDYDVHNRELLNYLNTTHHDPATLSPPASPIRESTTKPAGCIAPPKLISFESWKDCKVMILRL